jgi:hypothetical protein
MQTYKYNDPPTGFTMATDAITINFVTESASNGTGFGLYYQTGTLSLNLFPGGPPPPTPNARELRLTSFSKVGACMV